MPNSIIKLIAATIALIAVSGCTNVQSAPNMADYSYVPSATAITVATPSNIEDF